MTSGSNPYPVVRLYFMADSLVILVMKSSQVWAWTLSCRFLISCTLYVRLRYSHGELRNLLQGNARKTTFVLFPERNFGQIFLTTIIQNHRSFSACVDLIYLAWKPFHSYYVHNRCFSKKCSRDNSGPVSICAPVFTSKIDISSCANWNSALIHPEWEKMNGRKK